MRVRVSGVWGQGCVNVCACAHEHVSLLSVPTVSGCVSVFARACLIRETGAIVRLSQRDLSIQEG